MFNQDRKQRKFITLTTSIVLALFLPNASADVVLVPGHVVGNVQIGSESINYMRVRAYNSEDSADQTLYPNTTSAPYDLTVNVPAGTTPTYTVRAENVRSSDPSGSNYDYFTFPTQSVVANENTPVTADFQLINPNYVEGTVTLTGSGKLRYMYVYAQPVTYTGYSHYTNQYADNLSRNSLDFEFPVSPGDMRCYGTAYLLNGANISLASQTVSPVGGVVSCDWSIDTPQVGQVEGTVGFSGSGVVNRFTVYSNGPTYRNLNLNSPGNPENYVLDDLSVGNYNVYSYAYLENFDDRFTFPFSAYDPGRMTAIQAGDVDTIDIIACQAFIDGTIDLIGAAALSDMNSAQVLVSGLNDNTLPGNGPSYGGSASDQINMADGSYDLIVSPGDWYTNYIYLRPYNPSVADYINQYMYIYDRSVMYTNNPASLASCGATVNRDFEYNMGSVTVNLSVSGGEVLSDPSLQGNCYEYDEDNVLQYQYYFNSTNYIQDNVTDGYVTFVAPQADCTNLQARAIVGGTQTTFGELDIEVIGGGEVVIDIGGPGLTVAEPEANLCIDGSETTVTGTATDDVGVATVTVNGNSALLNPAGGEGTLSTDFSATISLVEGANSIETIATDTSGKIGSDTRTVFRDAGAPSLSWTPANGSTTPLLSIDVEGTVSDDVGIDSVTVNGLPAALTPTGNPDEYAFSVSVPLVTGFNNITVAVTEETGCAEVVEVRRVTVVENLPPVADAGGPYTVDEGSIMSLDGSASSDPDGDPITFEWDFDYDGITFEVDASGTPTPSFSAATLDGPGSVTVAVWVSDSEDASDIDTAEVTINNVAPTASLDAPTSLDEGQAISLSLTGAFDPSSADTSAGFEYAFDCGTGYGAFGASNSASCPTTDNETRNVGGKIRDKDGAETEYTAAVVVNNVAPTASLEAPVSVDEGEAISLSLTGAFDPSLDDTNAGFEFAFDCGSGFGAFSASISTSCATTDDEVRTVGGKIRDKDGGVTEYTASVTVNNVDPVIASVTGDTIDEDGTATVSGEFSDVGLLDTFTVTIDWGEGSPESFAYPAGSTGFSETHQYLDDNPTATSSDVYGITVTVTDDDSGSDSDDSAGVTVNNIAPEVGDIAVDLDLVEIGTEIIASASFTDVGTQDTHVATWDWGDGSDAGTVTQGPGSGSVEDTHIYDEPGVYTIGLTVTDDDTGTDSVVHQYVVAYDPNGSFVTGGGRIDSPPGAYLDDPSLTGMANFGFVSKYKKGATIPTGHTEFQFKTAGLDFKSIEYEWLVVAGARAMFKGTGTIQHVDGSFGFMLTAVDGEISGGGGADKFRIKIWDANDDSIIVYDNEIGSPDDAEVTTVIQSGSIVIHSKGKK
jgi:hypothetical protein